MSERRPQDETTDPGPPPEEALDATLRALGAPVPAQTRRTPESAGLDAAHYHAEPHRPPKAHDEPPSSSKVSTTEPMASARTPLERDTIRMQPRDQRSDLTTVPRAAPAPSRMRAFAGALAFVLLVLGIASWALLRGGSPPDGPLATASGATPPARTSVVAVALPVPGPAMPPTATFVAPSDISSATSDPPRPTGRSSTTTTPASTALPRRAPTAATSATPMVSPSSPIATAPVAPTAPTSKYNRFLEEDKK